MMNTMSSTTAVINHAAGKWSLTDLFRSLFRTRREIKRISVLARRERLQQGYRWVPQRVWDRRSALLIDG